MQLRPLIDWRAGVLLLFCGLLGGLAATGDYDLLALLDVIRGLGPVPFALTFLVCTVVCVPASILMGSCGFVFGPVVGFLVGWSLFLFGSLLNFLIARMLLRSWVLERVSRRPLLRAIDRATQQRALFISVLVRLSPISPANPVSYFMGVTPVPLSRFLLGTGLGVVPVLLMNIIIGTTVSDLADLAAGQGEMPRGATIFAVVSTLVVTALITQFANTTLRSYLREEQDLDESEAHPA